MNQYQNPDLREVGIAFSEVQLAIAALRGATSPTRAEILVVLMNLIKRSDSFFVASRRSLAFLLGIMFFAPGSAKLVYSVFRFLRS